VKMTFGQKMPIERDEFAGAQPCSFALLDSLLRSAVRLVKWHVSSPGPN
jgi:hypothetical protein